MKRLRVAVLLAASALSACGADAPPPTGGSGAEAGARVTIEAIAFEPAVSEVGVGDTVTWTNQDSAVKHTITSGKPGDRGVPGLDNAKPDKPDGIFDGTVADTGDNFRFTFDETGTFDYFCRVHPVMTGSVEVTD